MKVAVLGCGGFGTALAVTLARAGRDVAMWGHDADNTMHLAGRIEIFHADQPHAFSCAGIKKAGECGDY